MRDEVVELELRGMPEEEVVDGKVTAAERSFLGLDVNERSDGTVTIYVINLRRKRNAVDKFHHDPKTGYATFVRRFEMEHPDSAWVPDDVFAIPEYDDGEWVLLGGEDEERRTEKGRQGKGRERRISMLIR